MTKGGKDIRKKSRSIRWVKTDFSERALNYDLRRGISRGWEKSNTNAMNYKDCGCSKSRHKQNTAHLQKEEIGGIGT